MYGGPLMRLPFNPLLAWKNLPVPRQWFLIAMLGVLLSDGCDYFIAKPAGRRYWQMVVSLHPAEVQSIHLERTAQLEPKPPTAFHTLSPEETAAFLSLLPSAKEYSPNHPAVEWNYEVRIATKGAGEDRSMEFEIYDTRNDGTHIRFSSGWGGGTLRNDDLGPFLDHLFDKKP